MTLKDTEGVKPASKSSWRVSATTMYTNIAPVAAVSPCSVVDNFSANFRKCSKWLVPVESFFKQIGKPYSSFVFLSGIFFQMNNLVPAEWKVHSCSFSWSFLRLGELVGLTSAAISLSLSDTLKVFHDETLIAPSRRAVFCRAGPKAMSCIRAIRFDNSLCGGYWLNTQRQLAACMTADCLTCELFMYIQYVHA